MLQKEEMAQHITKENLCKHLKLYKLHINYIYFLNYIFYIN